MTANRHDKNGHHIDYDDKEKTWGFSIKEMTN